MKDPLRIFTKEQLKTLNLYNLRRLKKEFFIPIKFGGASLVVLNNHEIDKATLEAIFEELETNFDDYVLELESPVLNDFFDTGSISFLFNADKKKEVKDLIKKLPKLEEKIARKLNYAIADISQNINGNTFNSLNELLDFTSDFNFHNREIAYQKCYDDFEENFDKLKLTFTNPFDIHTGAIFKSEIGMHIDPLKAQAFNYLPKSFEPLDRKYSEWCYHVIALKSLSRQTDLSKFTKRDLRIFLDASKIASRYFDSESMKYNIKAAKETLKGGKTSFGGLSCIGAILVVFTLIKLIAVVANMNFTSSSSSPYSSRGSNSTQREQLEKLNKLLEQRRKKPESRPSKTSTDKETAIDSISSKSPRFVFKENENEPEKKRKKENTPVVIDYQKGYSLSKLSKHYTGDIWQLTNSKQTQIKNKKDTIIVKYESDLFPSTNRIVQEYLPTDFQLGKESQSNAALISFINKDLNIRTEHLLKLEYNDSGLVSKSYQSKQNDSNAKLNLSVKRIPYGSFSVKGHIMIRETKSNLLKEKVNFHIIYSTKDKLYKIKYGNKQTLELSKSDVNRPVGVRNKGQYYMKFATIINNLGQLHNKYLSEMNWYRVDAVSEYRIQSNSELSGNITESTSDTGNLRYNFTSAVDNYAYCELNTKQTALKYIVDHKSGIIKGMIRAIISDDKKEVEQIIVIRQ